ncbi:hypothetical protein JL193_16285 [Polaribacter batillariae]|uniref:Anti-sigma factor n=1 Tax=Polaribacter batillariae TaxID=2808900 RepID=A0ABX7SXN5_9FLAO|nr:hypothetical protein [Polaribacter batillariae]QTD37603.1 hypothetical protein JL193_16285 [Polaribacter batillariae]
METNKLDNNVKKKLENRTIKPSDSAWERLSAQLDEQPKQKKKGWFFYIGYAASILAFISLGIYLFSNDDEMQTPKQIIVEETIDTISIKNKIDKMFNEVPVEKAIVKNDKVEEKPVKKEVFKNNVIANKNTNVRSSAVEHSNKRIIAKNKIKPLVKKRQNNSSIIAKVKENSKNLISDSNVSKKDTNASKINSKTTNSSIKVNSEDLLYAVTHSESEVKKYYAKYNVTKEDVLKTIKSELKKSNLKVNPETILAEVERTINHDTFQNNFLNTLKNKITNIATAIANRNN